MSHIRTRRASGKAFAALTMALLALGTTAGTATAGTAGQDRAPFAAQARAAGLDGGRAAELQRQVDAELAATGGTQVGVNKIDLDGKGFMLLPLPGEKRARDLDGGEAGILGDPCYRGYACFYQYENFEGPSFNLYDCGVRHAISWSGTGSWINNQPSKYRVKFYDVNGNLGWTSPGGPVSDAHAPWGWVYAVAAC
ncbi:hypothetical protein ACIQOW_31225 [Kitasatospora sp. NPDC091335]|uniref:hypothetical protein n=1 Tax=Kitasatospora sp. NPDC091335 TaxID=3364085 RepID=UPI0037F78BE8